MEEVSSSVLLSPIELEEWSISSYARGVLDSLLLRFALGFGLRELLRTEEFVEDRLDALVKDGVEEQVHDISEDGCTDDWESSRFIFNDGAWECMH